MENPSHYSLTKYQFESTTDQFNPPFSSRREELARIKAKGEITPEEKQELMALNRSSCDDLFRLEPIYNPASGPCTIS